MTRVHWSFTATLVAVSALLAAAVALLVGGFREGAVALEASGGLVLLIAVAGVTGLARWVIRAERQRGRR